MYRKLFIPGPTEVREEVLKAQTRPMIGHRFPEFSELYKGIIEKIRKLLETENRIYIYTSSATGVMEGSIRNTVEKRLISFLNGAFSERWYKIALSNEKDADVISVEWGKAIKPEMVEEALRKKSYEAVLITHNESSTGVMNPLKEICEVMKKFPDTLLIVDAVSSLFGVPIEIDRWGIDVIFASVQKCLALPPGLTITVVSNRAFEKAKKTKNRGFYFDFITMEKYLEKHQTPATPAISLLYAMDMQLDRMLKEGMDKRFKRHLDMAVFARKWAKRHFQLFAEPGYESVSLTTILNERGIDVSALNKALASRGYVISNGYGKLKDKTFRIGHMGDLTLEELKNLLWNIEDILGLSHEDFDH